MSGNTWNRVGLFLMFGIAILSCTPKKELVSPTGEIARSVSRAERTRIISQVIQHQSYFETFRGRAKSRIRLNNKETHDVTIHIRVERDKAIWVSVTALMGIEAGRLLITPDSVKMINRLQGVYYAKPFDQIYGFASRELNFSSLQDLLTGRVIKQALTPDTEVSATETASILNGEGGDLSYWVQLSDNYRPVLTLLENEQAHQRLQATYANYRPFDGRPFPMEIGLSIRAGQFDIQAQMTYNSVAYDEALEMPFSIPTQYKEIQ